MDTLEDSQKEFQKMENDFKEKYPDKWEFVNEILIEFEEDWEMLKYLAIKIIRTL
jgi:hypothetical protein